MDYLWGQLLLLPYWNDWAPRGTLKCEGQLLPIMDYQALYSLLGTKFGGNGTTTFALPDLREEAPEGTYYCIVTEGIYPTRP